LADRIGIIHRGRLIEEIDTSRPPVGTADLLEVRVADPGRALELLKKTPGLGEIQLLEDGAIRILGAAAQPATVARLLVGAGMELHALCPIREELETRFLRLTGGDT
jgi:hypothetical protein